MTGPRHTGHATKMIIKTRVSILVVFMVLCSILPSMNTFSQEQVDWSDIFSGIAPCSIDATIFLGGKKHSVEKIATIYIEMPDSKHMFQQSRFTEPLPISFVSFSTGGTTIIHDFYTDKIVPLPEKLLPLFVFSLDGGKDSFFNTIKFPENSLDIDFDSKNIELRVSSPELRISPGIFVEDVSGYIWINGENMKPTKIVLTGSVELSIDEMSTVNLMLDFHYSGFSISPSDWKKVDAAAVAFDKKQQNADSIIRAIEKSSGRFPSALPNTEK